MPEPDGLQIEDVASRTGLTKRTIRYYEEIGLLRPPSRTEGGYRLFTEADVERLERIKRLREVMNFSLAEIKEHVEADELRQQLRVELRSDGDAARRLQRLGQLEAATAAQVRRIDEKLQQLQELRAEYDGRLARIRARLAEARTAAGMGEHGGA